MAFGQSRNREPLMDILTNNLEILRRSLSRIGPYLLVEIVLPGGTLLALLFYLYRRKVSITQPLLRSAMALALFPREAACEVENPTGQISISGAAVNSRQVMNSDGGNRAGLAAMRRASRGLPVPRIRKRARKSGIHRLPAHVPVPTVHDRTPDQPLDAVIGSPITRRIPRRAPSRRHTARARRPPPARSE